MINDPLHAEIRKRLAQKLDGAVFQACATAILGGIYPNLAPLHGGDDAGMDGVFYIEDGFYPLICTTQEKVISNLRKSLKTVKRTFPEIAKAVLATSRSLTPRQQRNLFKAAAENGFTLFPIYEALYFCNALYHDARWRRELLGITGDAPALSVYPLSARQYSPEPLIGRDEDLEWLNSQASDCLVVGHPGSGKTSLHQHLAMSNRCLFAVDDDPTRLANAIRSQRPKAIVVDDAHFRMDLIGRLMHLRAQLGAGFTIHANCWPLREESVQSTLSIPSNAIRQLKPLTSHQLVELLSQLGITGPNWLLHMIITQSDGKPGLASTLARTALRESVSVLWTGEAAAKTLLPSGLGAIIGTPERSLLAAFSVGGSAGMKMSVVSDFLGVSLVDARRLVVGLSAGGVIEEHAPDLFNVRPHSIRPFLVKEVFYSHASLRIGPLLEAAPSLPESTKVLLEAKQRGASISPDLLAGRVAEANSAGLWEHFAFIDRSCAELAISQIPTIICNASKGLLHQLPGRTIGLLLRADVDQVVRGLGAVNHPRRVIGEWLLSHESREVTLERRKVLIAALRAWHPTLSPIEWPTHVWGLAKVLHLSYSEVSMSPLGDDTMEIVNGCVPMETIREISLLWPHVLELLGGVPEVQLRSLVDEIENWCMPQRICRESSFFARNQEWIKACGKSMLADIVKVGNCCRALRTHAASLARRSCIYLDIEVDQLFDAVFGERHYFSTWQIEVEKTRAVLQPIAEQFCKMGAESTFNAIRELRAEAVGFGMDPNRGNLSQLIGHVAEQCEDPVEWIKELTQFDMPADYAESFMWQINLKCPSSLSDASCHLMESCGYQSTGLRYALHQPDSSLPSVEAAVILLLNDAVLSSVWLNREMIPVATMARLLSHENKQVRQIAAIAEWRGNDEDGAGKIRAPLVDLWKTVVPEMDDRCYCLEDIFVVYRELAFRWLCNVVSSEDEGGSGNDVVFAAACALLTQAERGHLLENFAIRDIDLRKFDLIVGDDLDLFVLWLRRHEDKSIKLRPLKRMVGPRWEALAVIALNEGVAPEDLEEYCLPEVWGGMGPLSAHFQGAMAEYQRLAEHSDKRLRLAGRAGLARVQEKYEFHLRWERRQRDYRG